MHICLWGKWIKLKTLKVHDRIILLRPVFIILLDSSSKSLRIQTTSKDAAHPTDMGVIKGCRLSPLLIQVINWGDRSLPLSNLVPITIFSSKITNYKEIPCKCNHKIKFTWLKWYIKRCYKQIQNKSIDVFKKRI